jgi:hypothetical protein
MANIFNWLRIRFAPSAVNRRCPKAASGAWFARSIRSDDESAWIGKVPGTPSGCLLPTNRPLVARLGRSPEMQAALQISNLRCKNKPFGDGMHNSRINRHELCAGHRVVHNFHHKGVLVFFPVREYGFCQRIRTLTYRCVGVLRSENTNGGPERRQGVQTISECVVARPSNATSETSAKRTCSPQLMGGEHHENC